MIITDTAAKLIERLNEVDESEDLEAKAIASNDPGKSVYETICALSNEPGLGGGVILLGVTKEVGLFSHYTVSGVSDPDKLSSDIVTTCNTAFNIPLRIDIEPERIGKKTVLKLIIPEVPKAQKPVYFKATGLPKGAYRRLGPSDVRCTDEDMSAFFAEQGQETPDIQIVKEASWHDIDSNAVRAYRKARQEAHSGASELDMSDEDMLHALGAIKKTEGKLKITLAGILLFGTQAALRRMLPSHRVDYLRVSSHSWAENPVTPFEAVELRGPLLLIASRVMATITDDLPKAFRIENQQEAQRTEMPVIPYRVVREAVINCLMHRNYRVNKPVQIVRYPNRIVIKNPGYSLKSEDRFDESGSALRNPHIAEVLHETRYAETKGSGIRVMKQLMAQNGLAAPTFDSDRNADEFSASFLFHHFLDEKDIAWLGNFKGLDLTQDQVKGLIFVREVGAISNSVYRSLNSVDTLVASKSLRKLRSMELLVEQGSGARTTYVPGSEFIRLVTMDGSTQRSDVTMDGKHVGSAKPTDLHSLFSNMPDKLKKDVRTAQLTQRLKTEPTLELIVRLCKWRALSLAELSDLLGKSPPHVSTKYVQPLLHDERLAYTIPEMIQHPHQKYRTVAGKA